MTEWNEALYDLHVDAMKAKERDDAERIAFRQHLQDMQGLDNYARLEAYKRRRLAYALEGPLV